MTEMNDLNIGETKGGSAHLDAQTVLRLKQYRIDHLKAHPGQPLSGWNGRAVSGAAGGLHRGRYCMEGAYRCWRGGAGLSGHGEVERGGMTTGGRQMLPFFKRYSQRGCLPRGGGIAGNG